MKEFFENGVSVSAMEKYGVYWKWPDRKDELFYDVHLYNIMFFEYLIFFSVPVLYYSVLSDTFF